MRWQGVSAEARLAEPDIPHAWETLEVNTEVPAGARQLTITVFDARQTLVKVLVDEKSPQPGQRTFAWNFKTDDGVDTGFGHFIYRVVDRREGKDAPWPSVPRAPRRMRSARKSSR